MLRTFSFYFVATTLALMLSACGAVKRGIDSGKRELRLAAEFYASCEELSQSFARMNERTDPVSLSGQAPGTAKTVLDSAAATSKTLLQVEGVDEPDALKITSRRIVYARNNHILILDRETRRELAKISVDLSSTPQLFVEGETLVVVGMDSSSGKSWVRFYAIDEQNPRLLREESVKGRVVRSRHVGKFIYLIAQNYTWSSAVASQSATSVSRIDDVSCARVLKPAVDDGDLSLVSVVSMAIDNSVARQELHVIGSAYEIFMTQNDLYLLKQGWNLVPPTSSLFGGEWNDSSVVTKVHFRAETGQLEARGSGWLPGQVKDSFALSEVGTGSQKYLAAATTEMAQRMKSHLVVLRDNGAFLETAAKLEDIAPGEDVRATRFEGDHVYVVTFEKTDPLFSISLADPLHPRIESVLEMPGFSTFLYKVGDNRLLGVGFDAVDQGDFSLYQGIQVSLFKVDGVKSSRLSNFTFGGRGSYSHAAQDHHAFYFDSETHLVALPVMEFSKVDPDSWNTGEHRTYSGARFFEVTDNELKSVGAVTHWDFVPSECRSREPWARGYFGDLFAPNDDIHRILKLDGRLTTISQFGLKQWSLDSGGLSELNEVKFSTGESLSALCESFNGFRTF